MTEGTDDSGAGSAASNGETASTINTTDAILLPLLEQKYVYQNPTTGTPSSAKLSVRQLCRMFCPLSAEAPRLFHGETQLLALQADGQTYSIEGWKPAREVPVIRHAACSGFYYANPSSSSGTTKGPVSCRKLAKLMLQRRENDHSQKERQTPLLDPLRDSVYSESTDNAWTLVNNLPDLAVALHAFADTVGAPKVDDHPSEMDTSLMVYPDEAEAALHPPSGTDDKYNPQAFEQQVKHELEAFLSSTDQLGGPIMSRQQQQLHHQCADDDDNDEGYETDGGTKYVKDHRTGLWIHQALAPPKPQPAAAINSNNSNCQDNPKKRKASKKAKFSAKHAKCWIYITGLPPDATEEEVTKFFSKVGIIDLDPETQKPKVKLYRHKHPSNSSQPGLCKGDASICFARPESVELALQVLDESPFRECFTSTNNNHHRQQYRIHVEPAKFEQHGDYTSEKDKKKRISQAQRQVAKLAAKQARDWDEGTSNGRLTGGLKGLRIIVLKGLFHPSEFAASDSTRLQEEEEDARVAELERQVRRVCEEFGHVEKITMFASNPQGVMVVKYSQPGAASEAVKAWNGRVFGSQERKVEACYWDGVTDFTVRDEEKDRHEMQQRHEEFGAWIDSHTADALPEEFKLKVEGEH